MQAAMSESLVDKYQPGILSVEQIISARSLENAYQAVADIYDFSRHPYFDWMKNTDKNSFALSQIPFRFAVEGFSCALAAVVARIPEFERRFKVAENVAEEHGLVGGKVAHKYTITRFLNVMGLEDNQLNIPCPAGVHSFNQSVRNFCLINSPESSAALLGMIEYSFIAVSTAVAGHAVSAGWFTSDSQQHYATHEKLDVEHARVLFDVCESAWANRANRADVGLGLVLGAYYFWDLYTQLLASVPHKQ